MCENCKARYGFDKGYGCSANMVEAADRWVAAKAVVAEQAEDEGLWFFGVTAPEGYLQQELRRLHAVIEGRRD